MRILFIIENFYPKIGGVETLFKSLCEELVKQGHSITVLTSGAGKNLPRKQNLNGINIIRLNFSNRYFFTFFAGFKAIKHALQSDFIHTTSYNAAVPAFVAGLLTRKKVLITFHEVWGKLWFELPYMNKFSLLLHYLFESFILKLKFDKFIAVSEYTKHALIKVGIPQQNLIRIYNGLDYDQFKVHANQVANSRFQFCYFGRLGMSKGLDLIMDALVMLRKETSHFEFKFIIPHQPKNLLDLLLDHIKRHQLESHIIIEHGLHFEALKSSIHASDAIVIPSYSEGFCFAAAESMALGTPIISSGRGALSEVVCGQYIQMARHDSTSLFEDMKKALKNEWSYSEPRSYPLSETIQAYTQLYNEIMNEVDKN